MGVCLVFCEVSTTPTRDRRIFLGSRSRYGVGPLLPNTTRCVFSKRCHSISLDLFYFFIDFTLNHFFKISVLSSFNVSLILKSESSV